MCFLEVRKENGNSSNDGKASHSNAHWFIFGKKRDLGSSYKEQDVGIGLNVYQSRSMHRVRDNDQREK